VASQDEYWFRLQQVSATPRAERRGNYYSILIMPVFLSKCQGKGERREWRACDSHGVPNDTARYVITIPELLPLRSSQDGPATAALPATISPTCRLPSLWVYSCLMTRNACRLHALTTDPMVGEPDIDGCRDNTPIEGWTNMIGHLGRRWNPRGPRRALLQSLILTGLLVEGLISASPSAAAPVAPYFSGVYLADIANATDNNANSYYETFNFNIRIDADIKSGSATVAAKVTCTTTGQTWNTAPWTIYGVEVDYCTVAFSESSFRGFITGPTSLNFSVELWNASFTQKYATTTSVVDQPFKAEPGPFIRRAAISNVRNTVDSNLDSYYEFFQFDLNIDADAAAGTSDTVAAKIICPTTGQTWTTGPWTITGSSVDYHTMTFDQSAFAGGILGPTNLDFTVELWNPGFTAKYDTHTLVDNEPFKAGPLPLISDARITNVTGTVDADGDGYFETFRFGIDADADMPGGSSVVSVKIICPTTGQTWTIGPWTVTGWAVDYHTLLLDQTSFSGHLVGQTGLDFTIELWDPSFTRKYASTGTVSGEPFKAEQACTISGVVTTISGTPLSGVMLTGLPGSPVTDSAGRYSVTVLPGWSASAAPTKSGYDFCPALRVYANVAADALGQNYVATPSSLSMTIRAAKLLSDESQVRVTGVVTAAFTDFFYIEDAAAIAGIRVSQSGNGRAVGERATVPGFVRGSQAERYISASASSASEAGIVVRPLGMQTGLVGGKSFFYSHQTASGQVGIAGAVGLNNIGMLVRTWGRVTHLEPGLCYVDDGRGLSNSSSYKGLMVQGEMPAQLQEGSYVQVTGAASCFSSPSSGVQPVILSTSIQTL